MSTKIDKNRRSFLIGMTGLAIFGTAEAKGHKCAICGKPAVGWCHMRKIWVCEKHRYFTQGGVHWQCP